MILVFDKCCLNHTGFGRAAGYGIGGLVELGYSRNAMGHKTNSQGRRDNILGETKTEMTASHFSLKLMEA